MVVVGAVVVAPDVVPLVVPGSVVVPVPPVDVPVVPPELAPQPAAALADLHLRVILAEETRKLRRASVPPCATEKMSSMNRFPLSRAGYGDVVSVSHPRPTTRHLAMRPTE